MNLMMVPLPAQFNDPQFLSALRAGDSAAFERLIREHGARLICVARRLLSVEEDARDAVQDAMIAAYRSIGSFESQSMLSTWLHRIVINTCLMKLRGRRRRPEETNIDDLLPSFKEDGHQTSPSVPWTESAETILQREEMREVVREAIQKLPETFRLVLQLRDIEELSTEETAQILGITPNAVKIRAHRARQALRTLLDPYMKRRVG